MAWPGGRRRPPRRLCAGHRAEGGAGRNENRVRIGPGTVSVLHVASADDDVANRDVWVYRPAVADTPVLPVVYMLHGIPGEAADFFHNGGAQMLDRLFASGTAPFVLAAPSGNGVAHPDTEWADSVDGRDLVESYLVERVIPAVEERESPRRCAPGGCRILDGWLRRGEHRVPPSRPVRRGGIVRGLLPHRRSRRRVRWRRGRRARRTIPRSKSNTSPMSASSSPTARTTRNRWCKANSRSSPGSRGRCWLRLISFVRRAGTAGISWLRTWRTLRALRLVGRHDPLRRDRPGPGYDHRTAADLPSVQPMRRRHS